MVFGLLALVVLVGAGLYGYWYWQVRTLFSGLPADMLADFYQAVVTNPCTAHLIAGRESEKTQKFDDAVDQYQRGVENCQEESAALNLRLHLGNALLKAGRVDESKLVFDDVLARDLQNTQAHVGLSFYYLKKGQREQGIRELRTFLAHAPQDDPDRKWAEEIVHKFDQLTAK